MATRTCGPAINRAAIALGSRYRGSLPAWRCRALDTDEVLIELGGCNSGPPARISACAALYFTDTGDPATDLLAVANVFDGSVIACVGGKFELEASELRFVEQPAEPAA
jgi:hypothetical protein